MFSGRAGRFGTQYDEGSVTCFKTPDLSQLKELLNQPIADIKVSHAIKVNSWFASFNFCCVISLILESWSHSNAWTNRTIPLPATESIARQFTCKKTAFTLFSYILLLCWIAHVFRIFLPTCVSWTATSTSCATWVWCASLRVSLNMLTSLSPLASPFVALPSASNPSSPPCLCRCDGLPLNTLERCLVQNAL